MTPKLTRFAIALLTVLSVAGLAGPALAHDELQTTAPANGDLLATAPGEVSVTFGEDAIALGTTIVVLDSTGADWVAGDVSVAGAIVTAPLKSDLPDGVYTVEWRVVSADGHPVTGAYVFGVGAGDAIAEELAVAAAVSAASTGSETPEPSESATATAATPASGKSAPSPIMVVLGALVAVGLLAGGIIVLRRSRIVEPTDRDDAR